MVASPECRETKRTLEGWSAIELYLYALLTGLGIRVEELRDRQHHEVGTSSCGLVLFRGSSCFVEGTPSIHECTVAGISFIVRLT